MMINGREPRDFVEFLEETLIPDLLDSGMNATAQDFDTACMMIRALDETMTTRPPLVKEEI